MATSQERLAAESGPDTEPGARAAPETSAPAGSGGRDAWEPMLIGWHVAFWLTLATATVFAVVSTDLDPTARWRAAVLLAVLSVGYLVGVMRAGSRSCGPLGWAYLAVAIVVVGLASAVHPVFALLLFIVFPQIWMFTPSPAWGVAAATTLTASAAAGMGTNLGWSEDFVRNTVPQLVVALLFSILLGFWIGKVIEQSRQRADLITQLQRTRQELALAHHAQGVMAERERVAREIHDTLAQGFTSIIMLAQAAQAGLERSLSGIGPDALPAARPDLDRLTVVEDVARENLAEARALVAAFSPVDLDGATLADALRRLADRFAETTGTRITLELAEPASGLDRAREVVLLRAVQEALANVRRHAAAASVTVRLVVDDVVARVEVTDDGVGFDAVQAEGFGLPGMRARVSEAGGRMSVHSIAGRGTRIAVEVPAGAAGEAS